jgi:hypothetical protein
VDWDELDDDLMLPQQWRYPARLCACGAQRLTLAVLIEAWRDLRHPPAGRPGIFAQTQQEARMWLMNHDLDVVVNLADVCAALNLSVKQVQRHLLPVMARHHS